MAADIAGYPKSETISGKRPDVIAAKNSEKIVLEVETADSVEKDARQHAAFKRSMPTVGQIHDSGRRSYSINHLAS